MGAYSVAQAKQELERLLDEALKGEVVTITRDGRPVATLNATAPEEARLPIDDDYLDWLHKRTLTRPSLGGDSVTLVREMRDEER